jgi:anhydro-N-acetylmuramic acid kinase
MTNYYIGLMSGTSMDGVDAALIDAMSHSLLAKHYLPMPQHLKNKLQGLSQTQTISLEEFSILNIELGNFFALAVNQLLKNTSIARDKITAIGSHGQTVCHSPDSNPAFTMQLGCAHTLATMTGISVVAEFRHKDLCLGGQGAPLAPLYHQELFHKEDKNIACLNLGGIANLSLLDSSGKVSGFDTGPANCLLDAWIKHNQNLDYDEGGNWARGGKINQRLLAKLFDDDYFLKPHPKSTDKAYFSLEWLNKKRDEQLNPQDVQATLLELTVQTVAQSLTQHFARCDELIVCGGGARNEYLLERLKSALTPVKVSISDDHGVDADYIEAMMFAWLAAKTLKRETLDLRNITGSSKPVILGAIYP